jgi:hypothetical protein
MIKVVFQDVERTPYDEWADVRGDVLPRIGERVVFNDAVYQVIMVTWDTQNSRIYVTTVRT